MANNAKNRHGKSTRKPVTLDLEAEKKASGTTETAKPAGGESRKVPDPEPVAMENAGPDTSARSAVEGSGDPRSSSTRTDTSKPAAAGKNAAADSAGATAAAGSAKGEHSRASSSTAGSAAASSAQRSSKRTSSISAGLAGGVGALVLAAVLQWAGLLPAPGRGIDLDPVQQRLDELRGDVDTLRSAPTPGTPEELQAQIDSATSAANNSQQALEALRSQVEAIDQRLADLNDAVSSGGAGENAGLETLSERVANLESSIASLSEQASASDADASAEAGQAVDEIANQLTSTQESVDSLSGSVDERFASLDQRLGELSSTVETTQQRLAAVEEDVDSGAGSRVAAAIAASGLKNAVDRGGTFMNELEAYAAVGGSQEDVEALREYAASGVPTLAQLNDRYPQVANRIVSGGANPAQDASFGERLFSSARSLVNVRPVGEVEGETPGAIAARMEVALQNGDLQRFISQWETLPESAQRESAEFAADVRARMRVDNLIDDVLTGAMQNAAPSEGE